MSACVFAAFARFLMLFASRPPDSLSFPTRRSSDLDGVRAVGDAMVRVWGARGTTAQTFHAARDRKSTRLNSSHLGISYAVFCLKKKKSPSQTPISSTRSPGRTERGLQKKSDTALRG